MRPGLFICTLCIPFSGVSQQRDIAKLNEVIRNFETREQVMGSIAFSENGEISYAFAFGYSDIGTQTRADTLTGYRIGSVSKMITSAMILQLVAEGKIALSDHLSRFFTTWPNANIITIEHLLRHESGLYNFGMSNDKAYQSTDPQSREDILTVFQNAPIAFTPGTKVDYNNANFVVLSLIIEEIDETSFAESLQARITGPLSLQHTHAGRPIHAQLNEASAYFWKNKWVENGDTYAPWLLGAGALVSTPIDLNVFSHALFTNQILPEVQLEAMLNINNGMGLGIYRLPFYHKTAYGHSGNIGAFESFSAYFPEEKVAFSVCLNANRKELNVLIIDCLQAYFGF